MLCAIKQGEKLTSPLLPVQNILKKVEEKSEKETTALEAHKELETVSLVANFRRLRISQHPQCLLKGTGPMHSWCNSTDLSGVTTEIHLFQCNYFPLFSPESRPC